MLITIELLFYFSLISYSFYEFIISSEYPYYWRSYISLNFKFPEGSILAYFYDIYFILKNLSLFIAT